MEGGKMLWTKTRDRDRVTAVIIRDRKLLLIHRFRDDLEYWVLPGGTMEEGETREAALEREVREELGLDVLSSEHLFSVATAGRVDHHFLVFVSEGEPVLGGPEITRANEKNRYIFTWLSSEEFDRTPEFYPAEARDLVALQLRK
jgi:8-oxo-dGTP diphosphatase